MFLTSWPARAALGVGLWLLAAGCAPRSTDAGPSAPRVVATTTMLADLAATLGGPHLVVEGIMRPGGDPHLYQPTPSDARRIAQSQLVITSGLHLEGWIDNLVKHAGGQRPIVVAAKGVEPIGMEGKSAGVDPHFWFDLREWKKAARTVATALTEVAPSQAARADIEARHGRYAAQVDALHAWISTQLASIPAPRRILITSHDAFNYFGRAYQLEVVGIQGISTESDAGQRDLVNVIELVRRRSVPAVFVETSVNPQLIERVARETGAARAGPLYSDSIGSADGPAATFLGTVAENVRMITTALGGVYEPWVPPSATAEVSAP